MTVTNSGSGYTSVPTVTISGGGGTGATAAAAIAPTAMAIASIPLFGAAATTVASVGLGALGLGCANPEYSSPVESESGGFNSYRELKQTLGDPGDGNQWHHVVEQCQINKSGFPVTMIQNPNNMMPVNAIEHAQISGYYNSIQPFSDGLRVRNWLAGQPYGFQYDFGFDVLKRFGH